MAAVVTGQNSLALAADPRPKLKIGLFADARLQPRWIVEAFAKVALSEFAEIACLAAGDARASRLPWPWQLYAKLDRWAFGADLTEELDLVEHVPHAQEAGDLDVAFAIGGIDDAQLDGIARYGVWRFHFNGEPEALAGLHEVARDVALAGSGLRVRLACGAAPRLAYQSWSRTYPLSAARNRGQLLRKTAELPWRALRELHRSGHGWLEQCRAVQLSEEKNCELKTKDLVGIGGRILRRGVEKALHVEQWFLAWRLGGRRGALSIPPDLAGFTRVVPPKDRTWADPFAIEKGGRHFVFFEELPFASRKAHIAMIEIGRDGRWSAPVRVLERDYHLSYPFLVESEGQLYMIPESAQNRSVELWRCVDFPLRWKLERVLLEGVRCVDATFHRCADRWWMFANCAAGESRVFDDELHLFHAERLLGEWQPHRRNPVKSDARCARPAGQLYWHNGALYRPAQICVPRYGAGLSINRVLRLTPQEYAERQVERVLPASSGTCGDGLLGIHTVNRAGYLTVVDAFARRRRI